MPKVVSFVPIVAPLSDDPDEAGGRTLEVRGWILEGCLKEAA